MAQVTETAKVTVRTNVVTDMVNFHVTVGNQRAIFKLLDLIRGGSDLDFFERALTKFYSRSIGYKLIESTPEGVATYEVTYQKD